MQILGIKVCRDDCPAPRLDIFPAAIIQQCQKLGIFCSAGGLSSQVVDDQKIRIEDVIISRNPVLRIVGRVFAAVYDIEHGRGRQVQNSMAFLQDLESDAFGQEGLAYPRWA